MVNCCKLSYFQQLQNFNVAHRCRWCVIGLYLFKLNNRKMQNVFKVNNKNPRTTSLIYVKRRRQGRLMTKTSAMIEVPIIEWLEFNASTLIKYLLPHKSFSIAHCVKSVQIRSYFWSVFSCIWIEYVNLRIQSEYRKIWTRNNCVFGHFSRSENYS